VTCIQKEEETRSINDFHPPIKKISDELGDEIKKVLPEEKSFKTVGRPIVPYRSACWNTLCTENRMPMENASQRTWFRFNMS
jgi:hypothetical protein